MAAPLRIPNNKEKDKHTSYPNFPPHPMLSVPPFPQMHMPMGPMPPRPDVMQQTNFYTSGTSNEQLNIYLYPHQTLFTHNNYITYLSDKLTVEHLPPIQLPLAFHSLPTYFDYLCKCFTYCFVSICKCSLFGIGNMVSFGTPDSNFYNTRLVINNNNISMKSASRIPYICLSPSLQISSSHSFGRRNFISPTHDSSSISSSLTRKILSINLSAQKSSSLIINIVNLFAYIINDSCVYSLCDSAENMSSSQLLLDFASPILPYKLLISPTYTNENSDRLLSSLERVLSSVTRFRPNRNSRNNDRNNNRNNRNINNNTNIADLVSLRTSARAKLRKKMRSSIASRRSGYCCVDVLRYLLLILSLALFPAVFILILMNQILEEMSSDNTLPISNTLCLVDIECPHYRRRRKKKNDLNDDTIIFLESNGDIYHKYLGNKESFYIRGECIIAFDKMLKKVCICNYGENGSNMREYRCKGDFIEFIGPGHLWYGNGKQDLLSNSYKLKSILFCDNIKYADTNYIPNISDLHIQSQQNNNNNNNNQLRGNYINGRFGIIQSFELRQKYKIKFVEKCLIISTITLVITSITLFIITMSLQPNFIDFAFDQINQFLDQFNLY